MDDLPQLPQLSTPTAHRPLLGLTVLVVEDSRFTCEALRLLCLKSGARIRRADMLSSARRHLRTYCPSVLIVDLGLPDGSGLDLIRELNRYERRVQVILATSGDDSLAEAALKAGADGFLPKPLTRVAGFQQAILKHLPADHAPPNPRKLSQEDVTPDALAYQDDLRHAAILLEPLQAAQDPDDEAQRMQDYIGRFLAGIARSAADAALQSEAEALLSNQRARKPTQGNLELLRSLLQERLAQHQAM